MAEDEGSAGGNPGDAIEPLLLPEQAAKFLNLSTSWLAKARGEETGPEFVKIGRAVRYSRASLRKFIRERSRSTTGGPGRGPKRRHRELR
jgi:hypothetical protein